MAELFKPTDHVGVTFVNTIMGRGVFNGVVNVQFGVFQFTPSQEGTVEADVAVACRLRMDLTCARKLHQELGELLTFIEDSEQKVAMGLPATDAAPQEKPN